MAAATGFTFTETMGGFVSQGADDFGRGLSQGKKQGERFRFKLTILADDLKAFLANPAHQARMTGTVSSTSLGEGLEVRNAAFNLLQRDTSSGRLRMGYHLEFTSADGVPYVMDGFKDVHNDRMVDVWYDTTALFTDVRPAEGAAGEAPAFRGILRIRLIDLVPQVLSMRGMNTKNPLGHAGALVRFNWFFSWTLMKEYARPPRRAPREASA
jgi:cholesterol oxidase